MSATITNPQRPRATGSSSRMRAPATCLGDYVDQVSANRRRIVAVTRSDQSVLLLDAPGSGIAGARVLAHLTPDEPHENARILCSMYLADPTRGQCRAINAGDLLPSAAPIAPRPPRALSSEPLVDSHGRSYCLRVLVNGQGLAELRWIRSPGRAGSRDGEPITLREVVGCLQDYRPARIASPEAIAQVKGHGVSTAELRGELARLMASPIVLNRALRERVQHQLDAGVLTLSEIAMRCGRVQRDQRGNGSGETSWLSRRIGLTCATGASEPSPWIHSDVLALIARDGIDVAPHEVEL
jgi:hypothetical protein